MKRLLLISRGKPPGYQDIFDHCEAEIRSFLGPKIRKILCLPFATDEHGVGINNRLVRMGYESKTLGLTDKPEQAIELCEAIFVPGGNTFRLLDKLQKHHLLESLRNKVLSGTPYIGSSAGANIAGPTIQTTNDMPIVWPTSPQALELLPFQINPHYVDLDLDNPPPGEPREVRIAEYLEENDRTVVGIYGPNLLRVEDNKISILGTGPGIRVFRSGVESEAFPPGADVGFLCSPNGNFYN